MSDDQTTLTTDAPPDFEVRLSGDKLSLLVTVADPHGDLAAVAARIAQTLPPLELAEEVSEETIGELLAEACQPGQHLEDHPLLSGQAPEPPRDGEVQWQEDFFATGFAIDEDHDRVDYWERAEHRAVAADQLLAVVLLPRDGKPGRNLQGGEIPVAKPKPARLRAGKGVRSEEQEDRILVHAAVSGRVTHKDGTVSVDDVYTVRGDVNLATGNVHHSGTLVVQGDVKEGARIECTGDVLVKGLVEPCTIACAGNLTVNGGIVGDPEYRLDVGGSLQARYLNDVTVRCGGDVLVTSQIDHSHVESMGAVAVPKGRIAGGTVKAYQGIQVAHAGSPGATGTTLIPGANWRLEDKHGERKPKLLMLQGIRDKLQKKIDDIVGTGMFADGQRQEVDDLQEKITKIGQALQAENEAREREVEDSNALAVRRVSVLESLWSGVTFRIGQASLASDRNYELPRLVTLRRNKVRILPMGERNAPEQPADPDAE